MRSLPRRILVCHGEQFAAVRTLHFRGAGDGSGKTGFVGDASGRDHLQDGQVLPAGIEQKPFSSGRVEVSETAGAKSGAVDRENAPITPDLAIVIDAWHTLPPDTRTAILAIVEAAHRR